MRFSAKTTLLNISKIIYIDKMLIERKKAGRERDFDKKVPKEHFLVFLLWLTSKGEMHGYEIIKILRSDKAIPSMAISKVYPLLSELSRKGLISQKKVMQGKRMKKLYSLTARGRDTLRRARANMRRSALAVQFAREMMI